ncbi:hypothetical protein GCM10022229_23850 [Luteimonas lutimaris]|uniref:Uncharacterized protein n=1 Tax=Luteimonas lutimaris TaxID=698645 RepID=A0ABP7MSK8_9GAMM
MHVERAQSGAADARLRREQVQQRDRVEAAAEADQDPSHAVFDAWHCEESGGQGVAHAAMVPRRRDAVIRRRARGSRGRSLE